MTNPGQNVSGSSPDLYSQRRILELDGLRAVAVIFVVAHHLYNYSGSFPGVDWLKKSMGFLGLFGVHLFFVISGFIITKLLIRENDGGGCISLRAFYVRRFFRIVPPFAVYLAFLLIIRELGLIEVSTNNLLVGAAFLGNWGLFDANSWLLAHTWSLGIEEQFYVVFPPFLCILLGAGRGRSLVVMTCLYLACACAFDFSDFVYILAGVTWALREQKITKWITDRPLMWPCFLAGLLVASSLCEISAFGFPIVTRILNPVFCVIFVAWFVCNPDKCAPLRWPVTQAIGACSYSIYIWQQFFTGSITSSGGAWDLAGFPFSLLWLAAFTWISYFFIEKPSTRLGRKISVRLFAKPTGQLNALSA